MIRLVMERAGLTFWPLFSFVIFLASSGVILLWLYRPGSAAFYGRLASMAMDGETDSNVNTIKNHSERNSQ